MSGEISVAERVAGNIRRLRLQRELTYKDLAERLEAAGSPIPVLGLSRLERGERRITVDDVVAFATVLEVSTEDLLFGEVTISVKREGQE